MPATEPRSTRELMLLQDPQLVQKTATIAASTKLSTAVTAGNRALVAIVTSTTWYTGAQMSFRKSYDGTTYYPVFDEYGAERLVTVQRRSWQDIDPTAFASLEYIKVRVGHHGVTYTGGTAATTATTVKLIFRYV